MVQFLWFLFGLLLGLTLDWVLVKVMLRPIEEKILQLQVRQNEQGLLLVKGKETLSKGNKRS